MKWTEVRPEPEYEPRPAMPRTYAEPLCDMANRMKPLQEACEFAQFAVAEVLVRQQIRDCIALARWIAKEKVRKV